MSDEQAELWRIRKRLDEAERLMNLLPSTVTIANPDLEQPLTDLGRCSALLRNMDQTDPAVRTERARIRAILQLDD